MKVRYMILLTGLFALCGCGGERVVGTPARATPTMPIAIATTSSVVTSSPAVEQTVSPTSEQMKAGMIVTEPITGTWRHITTADELCTDTPRFIGANQLDRTAISVIGTGSQVFCYWEADTNQWISTQLPEGNSVVGVSLVRIMPPAGFHAILDTGVRCEYPLYETKDKRTVPIAKPEWDCARLKNASLVWPQGMKQEEVLSAIGNVYRLSSDVLVSKFEQPTQRFDIRKLTGSQRAQTTTMAVSFSNMGTGIWVGTKEDGIVVITQESGVTQRITTHDGLPSNTIRDIDTQGEDLKQGRSSDIWVATDKGVAHFDGVKWTSYTTKAGLPSNDIRGVSSMFGKGVWAATAKGAAYFDRASNTWIDLTHKNELARQEMTGALFVPFVGADHSEVWFSTAGNGLITFTPHSS